MSDCYDILGVSKEFSDNELKRAYHKRAFKNHPDKNKGNPQALEVFKKSTEAYEILSDKEKREEYDKYGKINRTVANPTSIFDELFGVFAGDIFSQRIFSNNMISDNYESSHVIIDGDQKITKKKVHTPSGVRTTEYRETITHEAPTNIDILRSMSRLGLHSGRGI